MMASNIVENAAQMISRINSKHRPSLANLAPEIIPKHGPNPKEIIEIIGDTCVGKTMLLMELIAVAIIPIEHGGRGAAVILVDAASKFFMPNLVSILEKHILHHRMLMAGGAETEDLRIASHGDVKDVIELGLKNLLVIQCYTGDDFDRALLQVHTLVLFNQKWSMLAVESLGAYYWTSIRSDRLLRMETYMTNQLKAAKKVTDDLSIVLAYTRAAYLPTEPQFARQVKVDYTVRLSAVGDAGKFNAAVLCDGTWHETQYTIKHFGIQWEYSKNDNE